MTIYILNSGSIQELREADLINPRLICTDNKSYQYSEEGELSCAMGDGVGFAGRGRNRGRIPADRDANCSIVRMLEISRLACFLGVYPGRFLHLDPGNTIHLG